MMAYSLKMVNYLKNERPDTDNTYWIEMAHKKTVNCMSDYFKMFLIKVRIKIVLDN